MGQIQIYNKKNTISTKRPAKTDIIITKYEKKIDYNENGEKIEKRIPYKVNITKKINETAKLIKEQTAQEKLAELEKIFTSKK